MDLRTFFGDWTVNQIIHIRQGEREYLGRVDHFENDKVVISNGTEGQSNSFYFLLAKDGNGSGHATYTFQLQPGAGLAPSYFDGSNLQGTILVGPPSPSALILGNTFSYSSNTLVMRVNGNVNLSQNRRGSEKSRIHLNISHPRLDVAPIEFCGECQ